jgi:hypothetical protein
LPLAQALCVPIGLPVPKEVERFSPKHPASCTLVTVMAVNGCKTCAPES